MKNLMVKMRNIINYGLWFLIVLLMACQPKKEPSEAPFVEAGSTKTIPSWITNEYVMGHFEPREHEDFVLVDEKYADNPERILHKKTYKAFQKMHAAALADGHNLIIKSATRNFEYQKGIWRRKWTGATRLEAGTNAAEIEDPVERAKKILLYSSMPGASRHHWGTDIDLNNFENSYFKEGEGLALYNWLLRNAHKYGFCQPYTDKSDGRTGYEEERWHWSYMPLSQPLTQYCKLHIMNHMIQGFEGSQVAPKVDILNNYILGVDQRCI